MKKEWLCRLSMVVFFTLCLLANSAYAEKGIFLKVTYLKPEGGFSKTQEAVIDRLINEFQDRGYAISEKPEWQILVGIYHQDQKKVLITYTIMQTLPQPIIEFGTKNQVFYLMMDENEDDSQKNNEIREKLTTDFLHQFSMLIDTKYKIVVESELEDGIKAIVSDIDSYMGTISR